MEICAVGAELFTNIDKTDMTELMVAFGNFSNEIKNFT
jgi:hypothetical protein